MSELKQHEKILVIMFRDYMSGKDYRFAKWWRASDFQREQYGEFVGYEATARMSELYKKYPFMFESRIENRLRELKFRFSDAYAIHAKIPYELGRHLVREKIIV